MGPARNDFEFNGQFYMQVCGTAMGKKFAPSYANIFMAQWEKKILKKVPHQPLVYFRFLDDVFMIWTHGREKLDQFLDILNNDNPCIKLKAEISDISVDFLDVTIFKGKRFDQERKLDTKVYHKPTDTLQLLHKTSYHPPHTFSGIVKSQVIRYFRLSTGLENFDADCLKLFNVLCKRGYSRSHLRKIKRDTYLELIGKKTPKKKKRPEYERLIPSSRPQNQGSIAPCGSDRCMTCRVVPKTDKWTSTQTGTTYYPTAHLSCDSANVIYIINCKRCDIQYVGMTTCKLRERMWKHRGDITNEKETPVGYHFTTNDHQGMEDFEILPVAQLANIINRNKKINESRLLDLETYVINQIKSVEPYGLNSRTQADRELLPIVVPYSEPGVEWAQKTKEIYESQLRVQGPTIFTHEVVTHLCLCGLLGVGRLPKCAVSLKVAI